MKEQSFEEAICELEKIVEKLESGEKTLDESMKLFEDGMNLSAYCNKALDEAEKKIVKLVEKNGEMLEEEI